MNADQKKWLLDLQSKGVKFENVSVNGKIWYKGPWEFKNDPKDYIISAQPIPDIPDWRELCREMKSKAVEFETVCGDGSWKKSGPYFFPDLIGKEEYRIPQQPLPAWREEMTEETKPDPREEIPHRELQIQWHEDMLHHLRTGEPMREWEFRLVNEDGDAASEWKLLSNRHPSWAKTQEYRRKPRTVTYWHCVGGYMDSVGKKDTTYFASGDWNDLLSETERYKARFPLAKFSPITETTVEVEG